MPLNLIWIGLIVFSLIMVIVGYLGYRRTANSMEDFVLGGRTLGPIAGFFTASVTTFSAFSYFGIMGWYFADGIGTWSLVSELVFMALLIYFAGTRIWALGRVHGFLNVTEYLSDRYKSSAVGITAGLIMIGALVPYVGAQFRGSGLTLEAMTDGAIPFWGGALFLAAVVSIYVMAGGFRGVVWTDVIQGALMYVLIVAVMFIVVYDVAGGFSNLMTEAHRIEPALLSNPGPNGLFSGPFMFSLMLLFAFGIFVFPHMQQRWLAARSHRSLKLIAVSMSFGIIVIYLSSFYLAMAGRVRYGDIENPESIYPMLVADLLPSGLALLALIAILAATTTTANALILTVSSIATNEYYKPLVERRRRLRGTAKVDDKATTNVTRALLPVVVGTALLLTFFGPPSIIGLVVDLTFPAMLVTVPTILAGLYWKRATAVGALASMIGGLALLVPVFAGWISIDLGGWHPGVVIGAIATMTFIVVSLMTSPVSAERIERHFALFDAKTGESGDLERPGGTSIRESSEEEVV